MGFISMEQFMVATTPMIRAAAGLSLNFGPSDSEKAILLRGS
jgi:hypothetical protein